MTVSDSALIQQTNRTRVIPADDGIQWHIQPAVADFLLDSGSSPE
jgi:hypothetical protein